MTFHFCHQIFFFLANKVDILKVFGLLIVDTTNYFREYRAEKQKIIILVYIAEKFEISLNQLDAVNQPEIDT